MKTLREIMGLRDSYGDIRLGDTVRIVRGGHVRKVEAIGRYGLLAIQGCWGVYSPAEVEKVDKKNNGLISRNNQLHSIIYRMECQGG